MHLRAWLLAATVSLGACSQHGQGDMRAAMVENPVGDEHMALADAGEPAARPISALSGLFAPASFASGFKQTNVEQAPPQAADSEHIPGVFSAHNAPPPPPRPDFGDRTAVADEPAAPAPAPAKASWLASLTTSFTPSEIEPVAEGFRPDPAARARHASLVAYEHKEVGVPMPDSITAAAKPATPIAFTPANLQVAGVTTPEPPARPQGAKRWRAAYDEVETSCFPQRLKQALDKIGDHFGSEVLVTSGRRKTGRSGSLHRTCMVADIRVVGVDPSEVARVARGIPGVNGVGTYRHVAVTHVDVREERWAWRW